ncbi:MAG: hypothetical protein FWD53_12265 [Phycisphaerales bacterium]|nr:hypothetical protein [Phycisphaerales bacterium]
MLKLLVMLVSFLLMGLVLFGLRQQRLEVHAQCAALYHEIDDRKDTLRNQREEISRVTNARALTMGLRNAGMETGDALQMRDDRTGRVRRARTVPTVETDLVEPLRR